MYYEGMKGVDIMSKEKTMIINSEICDTRKMQENVYEEYDEIILNSTIVIANKRSGARLFLRSLI